MSKEQLEDLLEAVRSILTNDGLWEDEKIYKLNEVLGL